MEPVTLTGERVVLTELRDSDVDLVTEYCRDPLFEHFVATPWPYEREHAVFFVHEYAAGGWERGDEATWAVREAPDGELLGAVGVRIPSGSVGYWLGAPHRGRGLMGEALDVMIDYAFATDGLALPKLVWDAAIGNVASAATARALGFRYTGESRGPLLGRDGEPAPTWLAELTPEQRGTRADWPVLP